ncbi:MAG: hypothetical protein GXY83_15665 [Rhodopirellula sp.]|nr:hypothetical protein [Rhodopirellula sp.]
MTDEEFSKGQIALIEQIAYRVGEIIADRVSKDVEKAIKLHAAECPVKETVNQAKGGWKVFTAVLAVVCTVIGWALSYIRTK